MTTCSPGNVELPRCLASCCVKSSFVSSREIGRTFGCPASFVAITSNTSAPKTHSPVLIGCTCCLVHFCKLQSVTVALKLFSLMLCCFEWTTL
uniref:Uncharacterized protein n=1 Tax=Trichuris muris TaxID=70415 RepID=A0A5S6Q509_TRIMR